MNVISATEAKNRLGAALSNLKNDSLLIEKNGKDLAMIFNANLGKSLVLNGYSTGLLSKSSVMTLLGYTWFGQLIDAMKEASMELPAPSEKYIQSMADQVYSLMAKQ